MRSANSLNHESAATAKCLWEQKTIDAVVFWRSTQLRDRTCMGRCLLLGKMQKTTKETMARVAMFPTRKNQRQLTWRGKHTFSLTSPKVTMLKALHFGLRWMRRRCDPHMAPCQIALAPKKMGSASAKLKSFLDRLQPAILASRPAFVRNSKRKMEQVLTAKRMVAALLKLQIQKAQKIWAVPSCS